MAAEASTLIPPMPTHAMPRYSKFRRKEIHRYLPVESGAMRTEKETKLSFEASVLHSGDPIALSTLAVADLSGELPAMGKLPQSPGSVMVLEIPTNRAHRAFSGLPSTNTETFSRQTH